MQWFSGACHWSELIFMGAMYAAAGESKTWLSQVRLSPATHLPSPLRHYRVVSASTRKAWWKLLLFELFGVVCDAACRSV